MGSFEDELQRGLRTILARRAAVGDQGPGTSDPLLITILDTSFCDEARSAHQAASSLEMRTMIIGESAFAPLPAAPPRTLTREEIFEDLRRVGPEKPLGYLPIASIVNFGGSVAELSAEAAGKGLVAITTPETTNYFQGEYKGGWPASLYVFDRKALGELLHSNRHLLEVNGVPTDPEGFIEHIRNNHIPERTPLYDLIADCFADYTNSSRLVPGGLG